MAAFLRFLVVGGGGFVVDAGLTLLMIHAGFAPWQARIPAIAAAMLCTWLANRHFTYGQSGHGRLVEAGRYALVAAVMACVNYLLFVGMVAVAVPPLPALVLATCLQTFVSFWAYRRFVFGRVA